MIYGERCFWRETSNYPQVIIVDARILLFLGLAVFNVGVLTFLLLLLMVGIFLLLAWKSIRFESALRLIRLFFLGLERPATTRPLRQPVNYIQYGPDGRWCPWRLRNLPYRGGGILALVCAVGLVLAPEKGNSWMYWQGLAPYYQTEEASPENLQRPLPGATPFYSPSPVNPDWYQGCLMPGINQHWCHPVLFKSPDNLDPLDRQNHGPKAREVFWPTRMNNGLDDTKTQPSCIWIVSPGDTLSFIAGVVYGYMTLWPELAAANGIEEPWHIYPDQCIIDLK